MKKTLLFLFATIFSFAQTVSLDPTFGNGGKVLNLNSKFICSSILQPDGKILVCGVNPPTSFLVSIERYNTDGSLDTTFGTSGKINTNLSIMRTNNQLLTLQNDGKIVVVGSLNSNICILRLLPDGNIDTSYGSNGYLNISPSINGSAECIKLLPDNSILVGGAKRTIAPYCDLVLLKVNSNGIVDSSFGSSGVFTYNIGNSVDSYDILTRIDINLFGEIIICAFSDLNSSLTNTKMVIMKLSSNGIIESTFANAGKKIIDLNTNAGSTDSSSLKIDASNNIILCGNVYENNSNISNLVLLKLDSNGNYVNTFGTNGIVKTNFSSTYEVLSDFYFDDAGKYVCGGNSRITSNNNYQFLLIRFNNDGSIDRDFNPSNGYTTEDFSPNNDLAYNILKQDDGKIVLVGTSDIDGNMNNFQGAMARFELSTMDTQNNNLLNSIVYPNPFQDSFSIKTNNSNSIKDIALYDIWGKSISVTPVLIDETITINTSNFTSGIYFLKVTQSEKTTTHKLVKTP